MCDVRYRLSKAAVTNISAFNLEITKRNVKVLTYG